MVECGLDGKRERGADSSIFIRLTKQKSLSKKVYTQSKVLTGGWRMSREGADVCDLGRAGEVRELGHVHQVHGHGDHGL